jgi:deoxyribonuclease V
MHLAVDVYYDTASARGACVGFARVEDDRPAFIVTESFTGAASDYEPGDFKKRELPYLVKLVELARVQAPEIESVIVDGYVWLDGARPGLGGHLFDALGGAIAIIGVAKTRYHSATAIEILRGESQSPLFVTAAGIEPATAATFVSALHGEHRIPTMLRIVDRASRGDPNPV